MRKSSLALIPKLSRNMSKSSTRLNLCRAILSQLDTIQSIQLNHEMAIFATEAKRGIAVSATLGINSNAVLSATLNSRSDLSDCCRDCDGSWFELKAEVVGCAVFLPCLGSLGVDGDFGLCETAVDGFALCRDCRGLGDEAN